MLPGEAGASWKSVKICLKKAVGNLACNVEVSPALSSVLDFRRLLPNTIFCFCVI